MKYCTKCQQEKGDHLRFCTVCGTSLIEKKSPSFVEDVIKLAKEYQTQLIQLAGLIGLIVIIIALVSLFEPLYIEVDILQLVYGFYILGGVFSTAGLILILTKKTNILSQVLIMVIGELLLLAISYLLDQAYRAIPTRYAFFGIGLGIYLIGLFLPQFREMGLIGTIWQLASVYLGYILLITAAGSSYFSRLIYSTALTLIVVLAHFSVIRSKNIYLFYWILPLEFFLLVRSQVVNSTEIISTSLIIIGTLPVLLYFYRNDLPAIKIGGYSVFESLFLVPQIALVFVISNGALKAPYPQMLIGMFILFWSSYFIVLRKQPAGDQTRQSSSSIFTILLVAGIGFSVSNQVVGAMVSLVMVYLFVVFQISEPNQISEKIVLSLVVTIISSSILVFLHFENPYYVLFPIIGGILIQILLLLRKFGNEGIKSSLLLYQVFFAFFSSIFFFSDYDMIYLVPISVVLQLFIIIVRKGAERTDLINVISLGLPLISAYRLTYSFFNQWIIIGSSVAVMVIYLSLPVVRDRLLSSSVLALPLVFILSSTLNWIQEGAIFGILLVMGCYFLLLDRETTDNKIMFNLFFITTLYLFYVNQIEGKIVTFEQTSMIFLAIYVLYTLIILVAQIMTPSPTENPHKVAVDSGVMQIFWLLASFLVLSIISAQDLAKTEIIYYIISGVILFELLYNNFIRKDQIAKFDSFFLILSLLILSVSFSMLNYYYVPIAAGYFVLVIDNFIPSQTHEGRLNLIHTILNFVFLTVAAFLLSPVSSWILIAVWIIYTAIPMFKGTVQNIIDSGITNKNTSGIVKLVISAVVLVAGGINLAADYISIEQLYIMLSGISIIILIWCFFQKQELLSLVSVSILTIVIVYYTQLMQDILILMVINISLVVLFMINETGLRRPTSRKILPVTNIYTMTMVLLYIALIVELGTVMISMRLVNFQEFNQILILIGFGVIISSIILEKLFNSTNFTDGLLYLGPSTYIIGTFVGFYDVLFSNLIFASSAMVIAIIGILVKKTNILRIAIGLSVISLLKGLFDLYLLDAFNRSISLLVVGVQIIFYVIIFSNNFQVFDSSKAEIEPDEEIEKPNK